jgi:hypothetical protein
MPTSSANLVPGGRLTRNGKHPENPGRNLGLIPRMQLFLLRCSQYVLVQSELLMRPFITWLFSLRGIAYFVVRRSGESYEGLDELFAHTERMFQDAKEIRIAVGEVGHRLMNDPRLITFLKTAHERNNATIEIVNGINVDPKTKDVFDLEKQGIVRLFRMPNYKRDHFFHLTSLTGKACIIEEGTHNETLWNIGEAGVAQEVFSSNVLLFYVMEASKWRARYLREEYDRRKRSGSPIFENPGISSPPNLASLDITWTTLFNIPIKHALQPLAMWLDSTFDFSFSSSYKRIASLAIPLTPESRRTLTNPKPIIIERIRTTLDPKIKETPCSCGGVLRYGFFSFSSTMNGQKLEVRNVQGYKCDRAGCHVILFPEPIAKEMEWHIDLARGNLSPLKRIEGIVKQYARDGSR